MTDAFQHFLFLRRQIRSYRWSAHRTFPIPSPSSCLLTNPSPFCLKLCSCKRLTLLSKLLCWATVWKGRRVRLKGRAARPKPRAVVSPSARIRLSLSPCFHSLTIPLPLPFFPSAFPSCLYGRSGRTLEKAFDRGWIDAAEISHGLFEHLNEGRRSQTF